MSRGGWLPVGIIKAFVSREKWEAWVEAAFEEMVELAVRLEYPMVVEAELEVPVEVE